MREGRAEGAAFLLQFQLFPVFGDLFGGIGLYFAEDVGVAEDEFLAEAVAHVLDVEMSFLASDFGVEGHVQQYVSQFLADVRLVVAHQGVT